MEQMNDTMGMLDLMIRPGFCVKDNSIIKVNHAAQAQLVEVGTDIRTLLQTGQEEYCEFQGGCLYLTLTISGRCWGASVTRIEGFDVFLLEQEEDQSELQAMALAAQELRAPLANVMTTADRLFPLVALDEDPAIQEQVARLNRGLFQMLRVIGNMSDANRYSKSSAFHQQTVDICAVFSEIFRKAADLVSHTGITLSFANLNQPVICLADGEKLERAVLNIVSNAIKFTPKGGTIACQLTRRGNKLYLSIQDNGSGVDSAIKGSVYHRYKREPGLEEGRFGIGLGMVLIRSAAAHHGGTVLMDHPEGVGTRVTMTIEIRQSTETTVRSGIYSFDYAGERDHGLIELADSLPFDAYYSQKVN